MVSAPVLLEHPMDGQLGVVFAVGTVVATSSGCGELAQKVVRGPEKQQQKLSGGKDAKSSPKKATAAAVVCDVIISGAVVAPKKAVVAA